MGSSHAGTTLAFRSRRRGLGRNFFYRQMHQGRARTSSPSAALRLWLVGLAFLLGNLWIWIRCRVTALPSRGRRLLKKDGFTFQWMLR